MYVKKNYSFWMTLLWSKHPFIYGAIYSLLICCSSTQWNLSIAMPWQPISVMGIAVAFYLGFKNNSSYDRTWEARKIWGGIVNNSRSFAGSFIAFSSSRASKEEIQTVIYRHLAWLTALQHQLRLSRPWEHTEERLNQLYASVVCENYNQKLHTAFQRFLSDTESEGVLAKTNAAAQLLKNQLQALQDMADKGIYNDFQHMALQKLVHKLYDEQGRSERIKNFPFPRQYASTALWLTFIFSAFVPFGLLDVLQDYGTVSAWLCPLLSALIIWIFFLMEKIGDYSENPFEGTYNDVPITSIARRIEIDLLEMLEEQEIPKPIEPVHGFLM